MEFNTGFKLPELGEYLGIVPLAILAFGGFFLIISLANEGLFLQESFTIFLYGVVSSFVRQVYKDHIAFLEREGKKWSNDHKVSWRWYYSFQAVLFIAFTFLFLHLSTFVWF